MISRVVAEAELDHNDAGGESSIRPSPAVQDVAPILPNTRILTIPTGGILHGQHSTDEEESWIPLSIHTAKCDRCGKHNTSVVQRSSRENKQFCKPCMHLNVSDGIYTVGVDGLNWSPQTASAKRTSQSRKPKQPERPKKAPAVTPASTRVSKRTRKETKSSANKRIRLVEQLERESRNSDSLFVTEDEASDEEGEMDDNIGFGQLLPGTHFSSDGQVTTCTQSSSIAETTESIVLADEVGERIENGKKETESPSTYNINKPERPPWWEQSQATESSAQAEPRESIWNSDVHFSLIERSRSEFPPEAVAAANVLLMLSQDPRAF